MTQILLKAKAQNYASFIKWLVEIILKYRSEYAFIIFKVADKNIVTTGLKKFFFKLYKSPLNPIFDKKRC